MTDSNGPGPQGWPWVRTQIHPEAHARATQVAENLGWTMPRLYAFAIHYVLMRLSVKRAERLVRDALEKYEGAGHVHREEE